MGQRVDKVKYLQNTCFNNIIIWECLLFSCKCSAVVNSCMMDQEHRSLQTPWWWGPPCSHLQCLLPGPYPPKLKLRLKRSSSQDAETPSRQVWTTDCHAVWAGVSGPAGRERGSANPKYKQQSRAQVSKQGLLSQHQRRRDVPCTMSSAGVQTLGTSAHSNSPVGGKLWEMCTPGS